MTTTSSLNPWIACKPTDTGKSMGLSGVSSNSNSRSFKDVVAGGSSSSSPKLDLVQTSLKASIFGRLLQIDQAMAFISHPSVARILVEMDVFKKHPKEICLVLQNLGTYKK
ncbi:hypothetical protein IEQ34_003901 [Dendrobium chrysotoxum]|uniref:Uncharacterized protein n=1 Tax=Dendrobium chrysotoxum TaxID=161865 RepID=A0AAV7HF52_DENCH|nr:hypothetical protein IEQ34_003901 [Dendrobium chrysotoxum]